MKELYYIIFFEPLVNLLVFLHSFISDFSILIIVLTVIIRLLLWPVMQSGLKSQKTMMAMQPKLENLKHKHKDNKEELAKATMELYKTERFNPFSSCLGLFIQIPFMIALFQVLMLDIPKDAQQYLYTFINMPLDFDRFSFVFGDMSKPNIILAGLAGIAQFWQSKQLEVHRPKPISKGQKEDMMATMQKQMLYILPVMTTVMGIALPGGLSLYWLVTTLLLGLQQEYFFAKKPSAC